MTTIRHVIGNGEGVVIGCGTCGEVETLYGDATHRCVGSSDPTAATISSSRVRTTLTAPTKVALSGFRSTQN